MSNYFRLEGKDRMSEMSRAEGWAPTRSEPILGKAYHTKDVSAQSHTYQALSNHLHLYSNLCMKLALPLPPIWAQLELGHQQGLVLINLLIHAASTSLIFLLLLWERKLKKELPGMMHPAAVSSEFQKARAEVWWDLAKMDNVKGGSGTWNTAATGQGSDSWARNLDCNTLSEAWK